MLVKNVGKTDKIIRLIFVCTCIVVALVTKNYWFLLGALPLFSVVTSWCPMYIMLGFRTCPLNTKKE
jgi:hypothetical protein